MNGMIFIGLSNYYKNYRLHAIINNILEVFKFCNKLNTLHSYFPISYDSLPFDDIIPIGWQQVFYLI
jgi:hypothetical protein